MRLIELLGQFDINSINWKPRKLDVLRDDTSRLPHAHKYPELFNVLISYPMFDMNFVQNLKRNSIFVPIHKAF